MGCGWQRESSPLLDAGAGTAVLEMFLVGAVRVEAEQPAPSNFASGPWMWDLIQHSRGFGGWCTRWRCGRVFWWSGWSGWGLT
jgi:hypothetical protein